jgi:SAM-dependent methyltransferase
LSDERKAHWEKVHAARAPTEVSWYQPVPARSLELIRATGAPLSAPILDVGGGASTLVDHLVGAGFTDVTVLDVASTALGLARARLGPAADRVTWVEADVTRFRPARRYQVWHDRAVFHFLTEAADRERYLEVLRGALRPAGCFVLATFGPEGPTRCSGLAVERYSAAGISTLLGRDFQLRMQQIEEHRTPAGAVQQFLCGWWQAEGPD